MEIKIAYEWLLRLNGKFRSWLIKNFTEYLNKIN